MPKDALTLQLPPNLKEALENVSEYTGLSENDLVKLALVDFLSNPGRLSRLDETIKTRVRDDKYLH